MASTSTNIHFYTSDADKKGKLAFEVADLDNFVSLRLNISVGNQFHNTTVFLSPEKAGEQLQALAAQLTTLANEFSLREKEEANA